MSNSYKKKAVVKDLSNSYMKKIFARIFRRKIKQLVKKEEEYLPNAKEVMNQYDVCDWKSQCYNDDTCYCLKTYGYKKCIKK